MYSYPSKGVGVDIIAVRDFVEERFSGKLGETWTSRQTSRKSNFDVNNKHLSLNVNTISGRSAQRRHNRLQGDSEHRCEAVK